MQASSTPSIKTRIVDSGNAVLGITAAAIGWQTFANLFDAYLKPSLEQSNCHPIGIYILRLLWVGLGDVVFNFSLDLLYQSFRRVFEERKLAWGEYFKKAARAAVLNFINAASWQPLVDGGVLLGTYATGLPDTNALWVVFIASLVLFSANLLITAAARCVLRLNSPLFTNALADTFFYVEGPAPLPGSDSGNRELGWVVLLVFSAAVFAEGIGHLLSQLYNRCRRSATAQEGEQQPLVPQASSSFWRCCNRGAVVSEGKGSGFRRCCV